jgi:peptide-methionine (S)-S-oxide reductase
MNPRALGVGFVLVAVWGVAGGAWAQAPDPPRSEPARQEGEAAPAAEPGKDEPADANQGKDKEKPKPGKLQKATFGAGCFWCTEAVFQRVPGVKAVVSGYAGGSVPNPTYEMVSSGLTGHAEVVQILFDPAVVSYETLLQVFWRTHDPTTPNAQGPDFGTQYRSIILYSDDDQKRTALKVYRDLKARRILRGTVVTELEPLTAFYPAELYHQNYFNNHPYVPYSQTYIVPKVEKLHKLKVQPKEGEKAR